MLLSITGLVAVIYLSGRAFQAKSPIVLFSRNIFFARGIGIILAMGFGVQSLAYIGLNLWVGHMYTLWDVLPPVVCGTALLILTCWEYRIHREGVYEEGVLIKGIFFPWSKIAGIKVERFPSATNAILILFIQETAGRVAPWEVSLTSSVADDIQSCIEKFINHGTGDGGSVS